MINTSFTTASATGIYPMSLLTALAQGQPNHQGPIGGFSIMSGMPAGARPSIGADSPTVIVRKQHTTMSILGGGDPQQASAFRTQQQQLPDNPSQIIRITELSSRRLSEEGSANSVILLECSFVLWVLSWFDAHVSIYQRCRRCRRQVRWPALMTRRSMKTMTIWICQGWSRVVGRWWERSRGAIAQHSLLINWRSWSASLPILTIRMSSSGTVLKFIHLLVNMQLNGIYCRREELASRVHLTEARVQVLILFVSHRNNGD